MEKITKINLACGTEYLEGFCNIDNGSFYPNAKIDRKADIRKLNWKKNSLDYIRLSHFIMYTRPEELNKLVSKWKGWLKNGGTIEIETINIKKVAQIVADPKNQEELNKWGLTNIFGNPKTCPHQWGWTPGSLSLLLKENGFTGIKQFKGDKKPGRDFKMIAIK